MNVESDEGTHADDLSCDEETIVKVSVMKLILNLLALFSKKLGKNINPMIGKAFSELNSLSRSCKVFE